MDRTEQARRTAKRFADALQPVLAATTVYDLNVFMSEQHGVWPSSRLLKCEVVDLVLAKLIPSP
jgi:hypothetical protein